MTTIRLFGVSEQEIGEEKLSPGSFYKQICNWKDGDVSSTKFKLFPTKESLPQGSTLHLFDNFRSLENGLPISDTPNISLPFVANENYRKLIYHQLEPMVDGPCPITKDFLFRNGGLSKNIDRFTMAHNSKVVRQRQLKQISEPGMFLGIVNHNPIFRIVVRGQMSIWRSTEKYLSSILNLVCAMPERSHYLLVPFSPRIHPKNKFSQIVNKVTIGAISDKNSYQYAFLAMLYTYLNTQVTTKTVFDSIPEQVLKNINLVFEISDNYLVWPLETLKSLNDKNRIYNRVFNHFNGFILKGILKDSLETNLEDLVTENDNDASISKKINVVYSKTTGIPISELEDVQEETPVYSDKPEDVSDEEVDTKTKEIQSLVFGASNRLSDPTDSDVSSIVEENSISDNPLVPEDVEVPGTMEDKTEDNVVTESFYEGYEVSVLGETTNPLSVATTDKDVAHLGVSYMGKMDEEALDFIRNQTELTPAQVRRAEEMAKKYKDVTLDGKPLSAILSKPTDPNVADSAKLDPAQYSDIPDKGMLHSSISGMDQIYMESMYERHLCGIAASMGKQGMYLQSIDKTVKSTELNQSVEYVFKYKTVTGKQHTVKFEVPLVKKDSSFMVNGVRSTMSKQLTVKPICKVSDTRVSLTSNYNKTIVEKHKSVSHDFSAYFSTVLHFLQEKVPGAITIQYEAGDISSDVRCGSEYAAIARKYHSFNVTHATKPLKMSFYFGDKSKREEHPEFSKIKYWNVISDTEKKNDWNFVGIRECTKGDVPFGNAAFYMDRGSVLHMVGIQDKKPFDLTSSITTALQQSQGVFHSKQFTEWVNIRILDAKFPVGFLLCYRYGLLKTLRMLGAKFEILGRKSATSHMKDVIRLVFSDYVVVIPRYPLKVSMIFAGLTQYDLKQGSMEDYEKKDIYYQLLLSKNLGTGRANYLIGIDDTFDMFIDFMTYERLLQMNEPTTFGGLLVRATEMLVSNEYKAGSSSSHYLRSFERMNAILYNEMTSQMRIYKKQRTSNKTYSINPNAVMQRILQDASVMMVEDLNPIHDIKSTTKLTYLGMGGRTTESITGKDRKFDKDSVGIMSESTPSAGGVGIVMQSSMDPIVSNMYGFIDEKKPSELSPSNMLSVSGLLCPGITQDDPKRAAFTAIQLSHVVPVDGQEVLRVRTGYERMIAHRCSDIYAVTAEQDGVVEDVNELLKTLTVRYKDGSKVTISYDTQYGECSDMVTEQQQAITVKKGDKLKQNDVIRYNPQYFQPNPDNARQVDYKIGAVARVLLTESSKVLEDSSIITVDLAKRLNMYPIEVRTITLSKDIVVHKYCKIGDTVEVNDPLLTFELTDAAELAGVTKDDKALEYLEKLNMNSPKAKVSGTIVKVKVLYGCDLGELDTSVLKMVKEYTKEKDNIAKYSKGSKNSYDFPPSEQLPSGSRYRGTVIDSSTVVLQYYIREDIGTSSGDKIVIDSSLKTVIGDVLDVSPTTEKGHLIDAIFSISSKSNRIVNSPDLVGVSENIMMTLEETVLKEYFDK